LKQKTQKFLFDKKSFMILENEKLFLKRIIKKAIKQTLNTNIHRIGKQSLKNGT